MNSIEEKNEKTTNYLKEYNNYQEILSNISKNETMTGKDKYLLKYYINEVLGKENHIEILKIVIENTNKKIYTSNKTSTFFDLMDLPNSTLWKIHYYVNFCLQDMERKKTISSINEENQNLQSQFEKEIQEKLKKMDISCQKSHKLPQPINKLYTPDNVPTYETLMNEALYQDHSSNNNNSFTPNFSYSSSLKSSGIF